MFFSKPILLPDGKKPIMLTETMVNYFGYMVDSNKDGEPDAGGAGFANKLVVENGEIKAEYIDSTGAKLVGDYDFVPILETFIKAHPDFVYQGARATLAVTGNEGVFGYRTNTSYIATKSQAYYDQQVAGAKEVAQALRDKGYRLARFTYKNQNYKTLTATQIQEDITEWTKQIATPVLGTLDTFIFAQEGNISAYDGPVFQMLYNAGFRIFVSKDETPWAEINSTFVRQNRLMVTGKNMQWHKKQFENIFDCAAILDINVRGDVPNN